VSKSHREDKPHENVFAKFETPKDQAAVDSADSSAAFPDAPAPAKHQNWMNWKPADSADDDLVGSVTGEAKKDADVAKPAETVASEVKKDVDEAKPAVAAAAPTEPVHPATGSFLSKKHDLTVYNKEPEHVWKHLIDPTAVSVLTNDEMEFGIVNPDVDEAASTEVAPIAKPEASMSQTNSYMKSIDFGALTGDDTAEPETAKVAPSPKPQPKPEETPKAVAAAPVEKKKASFLNDIGFARVAQSFATGGAATARSLADVVADEMPAAILPMQRAKKHAALSEDAVVVSRQSSHDDLTDFLGGGPLHIMGRKTTGNVLDRYAEDLE
jgi:hypothetical protein